MIRNSKKPAISIHIVDGVAKKTGWLFFQCVTMHGIEELQQNGPLATLARDDGELLPAVYGWNTGSYWRGAQPRRKELFGFVLMTTLGVIIASVATVYLVLNCFQYLTVGYSVADTRSLAVGGEDGDGQCQGGSDDETGESRDIEEGAEGTGVSIPRHPETADVSQPAQHPAVGDLKEADEKERPSGEQAQAAGTSTTSVVAAREPGWGYRRMPESKIALVNACLLDLKTIAATCSANLSLLSIQDAYALTKRILTHAALELAALAGVPAECEPARQATVQLFIDFATRVRDTIFAQYPPNFGPHRITNLIAILREIQQTQDDQVKLTPLRYMKKQMGNLSLLVAALGHFKTSMKNLFPQRGSRPKVDIIHQELRAMKVVFERRLRQVLRDSYMRSWLCHCQKKVGYWAVFRCSDMRKKSDEIGLLPIPLAIKDLEDAVAQARQGQQVPVEEQGDHGQVQGAPAQIGTPQAEGEVGPTSVPTDSAPQVTPHTPSSLRGSALGTAGRRPDDGQPPSASSLQATPPGPQPTEGSSKHAADESDRQADLGLRPPAKPDEEDNTTDPLVQKLFESGLSWEDVFGTDDEDET